MPVSFVLSSEQIQIVSGASDFAENVLVNAAKTIAAGSGPEERFNSIKPYYQEMVNAGFMAGLIPREQGGSQLSSLDFALSSEELARVDINVPSTLLSTGLGLRPIIQFGSTEQRNRFLPQFTGNDPLLASFAFTDVGGAANFDSPTPGTGVRTTAVRDGDHWVINGHKQFTTNGTGWDRSFPALFTVLCNTDVSLPPTESLAIIVVPGDTPGISVDGIIDTAGHLATLSPKITFTDVRVPADYCLGVPGDGLNISRAAFTWTGAPIAAACVGRMRAAFDEARSFAMSQNRGGAVPIIDHQNVGYMLADIKIRIEAGRYLAWKAADQFDETSGGDREMANVAKIHNSELSVQVVYDAMRLIGVEAYSDLSPIPGILQDVLCFPVYDGGNMGVRRRQLHQMLADADYDPLSTVRPSLSRESAHCL